MAHPQALDRPIARSAAEAPGRVIAIPWLATSVLIAATAVVVGVIWDISWHMTIGRDTFWTPAHLAIHFGGIVGGVSSGAVVLQTTFGSSAAWRETAVRLWGFRGPLGAWVSIWGAFAMPGAILHALKKEGLAFGLPVTLLMDDKGCMIGAMNGPAVWDSEDAKALIRAAVEPVPAS